MARSNLLDVYDDGFGLREPDFPWIENDCIREVIRAAKRIPVLGTGPVKPSVVWSLFEHFAYLAIPGMISAFDDGKNVSPGFQIDERLGRNAVHESTRFQWDPVRFSFQGTKEHVMLCIRRHVLTRASEGAIRFLPLYGKGYF